MSDYFKTTEDLQRPKLDAPPKQTLDEIIVEYLRKVHHINVTPVSSNLNQGAAKNAAMFLAGGPLATGISSALHGQQKTAALQEWLQYKSFAMAQPDFAAYRDASWARHAQALAKHREKIQIYTKEMAKPENQKRIKELQEQRNKDSFNMVIGFIICLIIPLVVIQIPRMYDGEMKSESLRRADRIQPCKDRAEREANSLFDETEGWRGIEATSNWIKLCMQSELPVDKV